MIHNIPQCTKRTRVDEKTTCSDPEYSGKEITIHNCIDCPLADYGIPSAKPATGFFDGVSNLARGIIGTAKSHFGLGVAPEAVIQERYRICEKCPFNQFGKCIHEGCGCFVGSKIRVASESCPMTPPKWTPFHGDVQPA